LPGFEAASFIMMLEKLDLTRKLKDREWRELRLPLQRRLYDLQRALFLANVPAVVLVEGWAGAGKGAVIRALTQRLDPRGFRVWAMQSPTIPEQSRPWLWRYWMRLPERGQMVFFDGSWYGEILHAQAERRLSGDQARAAYRDCVDLERMLADDDQVIVKLWLQLDQREQRRRLRISDGEALRWPGSRAEDWAQHRRYREYLPLAEEMLEQSDVAGLRWNLIEAQDEAYARWRALDTVIATLEGALHERSLAAPSLVEPRELP
jgi:polyphosphate kinase 2 (PPK2 family)